MSRLPIPIDRRVLRDSFLTGILVWVGALAVIAPVTIRNLVKGGEFVLTTAHGGINFYIGNNPNADGWYKTPEHFEGSQEGLVRSGRALAERETGRSMSHSEVSRHWFAKGCAALAGNPGAAARLFLRKLYLFWHGYEKPLEGNIYYLEIFSPLLRFFTLGFGAVVPFALLGIVLALRKWRSGAALLAFFILVYMGTLVLFFVTSRYRIVAVPFLLLFGAQGAWWCLDRLRAARWKSLAGAAVLLAATGVLSNSFLFGLEGCVERDLAYSFYDAGNVHLSRGENSTAERSYSEAIALNPDVPYFYGNRGVALTKLGRHDLAFSVYETFVRRWPGSPQARYGLASTLHRLGRLGEAEKEYRAGLAIRPLHADTLENLARICESTGRGAEARALRQRAAARPPRGR